MQESIKLLTHKLGGELFSNCFEVKQAGKPLPGTYQLQLGQAGIVSAYCYKKGGTIIQTRGQFGNPKDYFERDWAQYEAGFGTPGTLNINLDLLV